MTEKVDSEKQHSVWWQVSSKANVVRTWLASA